MKKILLFASAVAMLASCSKDLTEDVAPSIQGNTRIIASLEADSSVDTRSHLVGGYAYWDMGDALGVFAATSGDKTNAYFGYNGTEFVGDLYMVKGESIYAYYPWTSGKALSGKKLSLTIPATQYYNHKYAAGDGSFAAGTVPAVGITTVEDKDVPLKVDLQPVASYIGIPIKGMGKVGSVTLKMYLGSEAEAEEAEVKYETPVTLTGTVTVDFATENAEEKHLDWTTNKMEETAFSIAATTGNGYTITLNCGDGVELDRNNAKYFVFVVPAYIDLATTGVKFVVTVNGMDSKTAAQTYDNVVDAATLKNANKGKGILSTYRNYYLGLDSWDVVWNEGGKLLIDNEEQFVKYAYLATYGWDENFDNVEDKAVAAALAAEKETYFNGAALRDATLMADLEFKGDLWFEKDLKESEKKALNAFEAAIYEAYNEGGTNPAITSIGGALKFSINGNKHSISGLNFNGSIFADTQKATSVVSDLELVNATVTADYFMATSNAVKGLTLTNVMTGEGCQLIPATEGQGAFYNTFNTSSGAPVYETLPTFAEGGESIKYANTLTVTKPASVAAPFFVALDAAAALEGEMNIKTADFNAIKTATAGTLYVIAKTDDTSVANVAKALIENDVIGYTGNSIWHSVVTRDAKGAVNGSYWTGRAATAVNEDGIFTAEELAFVVSKRTVIDEQTLTCNLTLTYKPWEVTSTSVKTAISIDGNKKTITGAQIKAKDTKAYNYSIFGYEANLKNLTVNSTTIDLTAYTVNKDAKVAVLATKPGEEGISGVTVGAPTIRMNAASTGVETVGGLFAEVGSVAEWEIINNEAADNKITTNTNATRYLANGAKFGSVVGKLTFDAEEPKTKLDYAKTVTTDAVNKIIGQVDFTNAPDNTEAHFAEFGEGQYPSLDTVLPANGKDFNKTVYVYNGTEKASFFWFPTQKAWVVTAE